MSAFIQSPPAPTTAFQHELAATAQHVATALPPAASQIIDGGIATVTAAGLTQHVLSAGQLAPDFILPAADGQPQSLAALLAQGPVVLAFYRGNWCPYCNVQLRAYQQALPELALRGATLVAVSPQVPALSSLTASEKKLAFPVLSDVGNVVARQYGLAYGVGAEVADTLRSVGIDLTAFNGTADDELPLTATFVINTDGVIGWRWVEANFKHRADPADLIRALEQLPAPQLA
ncbi:peroxiredoxin-like family protein [Hymenobacter arcticus]